MSNRVESIETIYSMVSVGVVVTVTEREMSMSTLLKSIRVSVGVNSIRSSVISSVTSTVAVVSKTCNVSVTVNVFVSVTIMSTVVDKVVLKLPEPIVIVASSVIVMGSITVSVKVGDSKVKKSVDSTTVSVSMLKMTGEDISTPKVSSEDNSIISTIGVVVCETITVIISCVGTKSVVVVSPTMTVVVTDVVSTNVVVVVDSLRKLVETETLVKTKTSPPVKVTEPVSVTTVVSKMETVLTSRPM